MHNQFNTTRFTSTKTGLRSVVSAALAGVFSLGVLSLVVTGMAEQSGGQSLGAFVAAQKAAPQATRVAAASAAPAAF